MLIHVLPATMHYAKKHILLFCFIYTVTFASRAKLLSYTMHNEHLPSHAAQVITTGKPSVQRIEHKNKPTMLMLSSSLSH